MVSHCGAKIALTTKLYQRARWFVGVKDSLSWFRSTRSNVDWPILEWIDVDSIQPREDEDDGWQPPQCGRNTPAFVQFSSGSTGAPKAAVITHYNLIWQAYVLGSHSPRPHTVVSWAPHWHDLGLNLNFMSTVYSHGAICVLMSPLDFLKSPSLWLRTISKYRGTVSVAPTFAYALAAAKTSDQEMVGLDLSCCTGFYVGAEPINPLVLEKFVERFAAVGAKPEHIHGTYGLAGAADC